MQEYRIQNQALFDRNYVPNMLGWYRLTATTSLVEMEWMLGARGRVGAGLPCPHARGTARQPPHAHPARRHPEWSMHGAPGLLELAAGAAAGSEA